ncbi:MAG: TetR/AcrR family transcriptional regulator [Pseudomonadota bacterium]
MTKNIAKKTAPVHSANGGRGEETRRMILDAAIKVFAKNPYNAASIRMVAAQGGFYHGLIRYHFPNKAELFQTVVEEICRNLIQANKEWVSEVSRLSPEKALAHYLDRFIEFCKNQPEVFRIIVQNISHDDPVSLPGYSNFLNLATSTQEEFENTYKGLPKNVVHSFLTSFNVLVVNYLGADKFNSELVGMTPKSDEYHRWVKETMLSIFLPLIKEMASSALSAF